MISSWISSAITTEKGTAGMVTRYEAQMYNDLHQIAQNLDRIANCLEAAEKRNQGQDLTPVHPDEIRWPR